MASISLFANRSQQRQTQVRESIRAVNNIPILLPYIAQLLSLVIPFHCVTIAKVAWHQAYNLVTARDENEAAVGDVNSVI